MRGEASEAIKGEAMNTERSECTERTECGERAEYIVYSKQTMHIMRRGETDHAPNEKTAKTAKTTKISNYGAFGEVHRID